MYNEPPNHIPNIFCKCKAKVSMWSSKGLWEAQLFSTFATCFSGDSFTWEYRCIHWEEFKGSDNNPKWEPTKTYSKEQNACMCFASLEKLYTHTGLITHCADQSCSILSDAQLPQETSSRNTFHNLDAGAQRSYSVKLAVVPWKGLLLVHWGYRKKWIKDFRRMACVAQTSLQFHGGLLILFGGRYKRMGPKPRWIQFRGLCQGFFPRSYWSLGCVCGDSCRLRLVLALVGFSVSTVTSCLFSACP